jgi:hypothetical protein
MKNRFFVEGDVAYIVLRHRDRSEVLTMVDADQLDVATSVLGTWTCCGGYARCGSLRLANLIAGRSPHPKYVCDHINRDPLDNRYSNLRWVSRSVNVANRNYVAVRIKGRTPTVSETVAGLRSFVHGVPFAKSFQGDGVFLSGYQHVLRGLLRTYLTPEKLHDLEATDPNLQAMERHMELLIVAAAGQRTAA